MKTAILSIGDELLIGQVLNSNAQWIAEKLTDLGLTVSHHLTVGDSASSIHASLDYLTATHQEIGALIVTGGLGPTHDDITMEALSQYFSIPLEYNANWVSKIEEYFKSRNRVMTENNKKQGYLLASATLIENDCGTAAGQFFTHQTEKNKINVFVLPGVPYEMKSMMERKVLPFFKELSHGTVLKQTLLITGIGESALAEKCDSFVKKLSKEMTLAFLPSSTSIRLRLQLNTPDGQRPDEKKFNALVNELKDICGADFFGFEPETIEGLIIQKLEGKSVSIAESCTGGLIAHRLTQIPGSSKVVRGAVIAYQRTIKETELLIPASMFEKHDEVSEAVVIAMAENIRKKWTTDYGVASTGYLGPSGSTHRGAPPVGTVWLAVATPGKTVTKAFTFENNRERNKERATQAALDLLRRQL